MTIKKIGIDCDGVLRDFIAGLIFVYRKHYPTHKIEKVTSFSLHDFFPIKEEIYDFYRDNAEEIFFKHSPLIENADRGMKYIRRLGYEISIITAQQEDYTLEPTINWLKKHKIKFDHLYNTKDKHLLDCYDVHIDDDPTIITNIVNAGKRVIIFSTEQNKNIPDEIERRTIRVKSWNELIELFEDVSKVESFIKNSISFSR